MQNKFARLVFVCNSLITEAIQKKHTINQHKLPDGKYEKIIGLNYPAAVGNNGEPCLKANLNVYLVKMLCNNYFAATKTRAPA